MQAHYRFALNLSTLIASATMGAVLTVLGIAISSPPGLEGTVLNYLTYHLGLGLIVNLIGSALGWVIRWNVPLWLAIGAFLTIVIVYGVTKQPVAGNTPDWKPLVTRLLGTVAMPIACALFAGSLRGMSRGKADA